MQHGVHVTHGERRQGLAIARAVVVDKHQGELTFETAIGQGTTFTIRLPIEASEQTRAA